ncbi:MAG TPA: LysR family transcriptional regulator [Aquabacterium sp.]|uniref:LysR family transcriptional regulator n=1 Tax=Aquabacterium sp. TaxID=1872578 RepID=UPI002E313F5B|nr:LysR family transcriptional regulator [Aquabacterium sp.]HEX5372367.1 LysR family transcriptional regulator [Aquabacterium sp.]
MDRLQTMKTFARVVDEGGFAAAARVMDVDQALVTRQVADLEKHLGVKLLERTTRSMRLTEAGEAYLARCRGILSEVSEAEALVSRSHQDMVGRVRMALPTLFGKEGIAQQLAELHEQFPDLVVEVAMLDRPVDPVAEGFDVVIMESAFGVSATAVSRSLLEVPFMLCASPAYLRKHPMPMHPRDLAAHHAVAQWASGEAGSAQERWTLAQSDGLVESVDLRVALRTNTYALSLEAVRCGMGIGRLTPRLLADDLAAGRLVHLLPGWRAGQLSFSLVYPGRRMLPRRVRHVIDAIVARCAELNQTLTRACPAAECLASE